MANETTTTTLTEIVNSEWISPVILEYAHDFVVATPFCKQYDLRGKASGVVAVPQWVSDQGALDIATETTALANTALETTEQTITTAEMGILREVVKNALEDSLMTPDELFDFIVADAGRLLGIAIEDDVVALFASFSTSVGTTTVDLTLADMAGAIAQLRKNGIRAPGGCVFILDDQQSEDFDAAGLASTSTTIGSYFQRSDMSGLDTGFVGAFAKYEVWQTGLCDTANLGADVVGALIVRGDMEVNAKWAPIGLAVSRLPEADFDKDIGLRTRKVAVTARWAPAEIFDLAGVGIVTDA